MTDRETDGRTGKTCNVACSYILDEVVKDEHSRGVVGLRQLRHESAHVLLLGHRLLQS